MLAKFLLLFALLGALGGCAALVERRAEAREEAAEDRWPPGGEIYEVDGRSVHAVVTGQGPDLVLIHGASGNTRDFTFDFVNRLRDRYRVIVFDRPGMGYSDLADPAYAGPFDTRAASPQEQAAILAKAAEQIGVENPIVLGHSYGGSVAMAWGLEHPASALVIVSGATQPWEGGLGALYTVTGSSLGGAALTPLITAFASDAQVDAAIESIFEPQEAPEGYAEYVGPGLSVRRQSFRANARQVTSLKPHVTAMKPLYPTIEMPVEIIHGTADTIVPAKVHAIPLSQQIEGAELTLLDGIGHMPHHVRPEAVTDAIDSAARRAGLR